MSSPEDCGVLANDPSTVPLSAYLFTESMPVAAQPLLGILPDPVDQLLLEVAFAAFAPLITSNLKHYPGEVCRSIEVLAAAAFVERWRNSYRESLLCLPTRCRLMHGLG